MTVYNSLIEEHSILNKLNIYVWTYWYNQLMTLYLIESTSTINSSSESII